MPKWEYLYVEVDFGSDKPRRVNGQELRNWKATSHISTFINELGEQGWELVGYFNQTRNTVNPMVFKRPKP